MKKKQRRKWTLPASVYFLLALAVASSTRLLCQGFVTFKQNDSLLKENREHDYACPSNCSNKGHCVMGNCFCLFGYSGENCAIMSETITLKPGGGSYKAHIASKSWRYFAVNVADSNPGHLEIDVISLANVTFHGTREGLEFRSQIAMFVGTGTLPDEKDFRSRCLQGMECAESNKLQVRVDEPQGSTWWIGVRSGLKDEYFSIGVETPLGLCSDSCSGRGVCLRNQCCCKPGSSGANCEEAQNSMTMPIELNRLVTGSLLKDNWRYYFLNRDHSTLAIQVVLKILSFSGKSGRAIHLVVNKSDVPQASASSISQKYEHSCKIEKQKIDDSHSVECSVKIQQPGSFAWFVGILGDDIEGSYALEIQSVSSCPHECNNNGKCNEKLGRCFCNGNYTGADCSHQNADLIVPLQSEESDTSLLRSAVKLGSHMFSLEPNEVNYHKVVIPKDFSDNLDIVVEEFSEGNSKGQSTWLQVQNGAMPRSDSFLAHKELLPGNRSVLSLTPIKQTQEQVLWLKTQSKGVSMYTIAAKRSVNQCTHDCNGQGFCQKGICQCHAGFAGISCGYHLSTPAKDISDAESESSSIVLEPYKWMGLKIDEHLRAPDKNDQNSVHLAVELKALPLAKSDDRALAPPNFSCVDIAVLVYNKEKVEYLAHRSHEYHNPDACSFQLPLTQGAFHLSRMEFIWQHRSSSFRDDPLNGSSRSDFLEASGRGSTRKERFEVRYDLILECPNNCSNSGVCQKGVCMCNHDRTGPDCSQTKAHIIAMERISTLGVNDEEEKDSVGERIGTEEDRGEYTQQSKIVHVKSLEEELEDSGFVTIDTSTMYSGYSAIGGVFFLILCLTVYMRYSDKRHVHGNGNNDPLSSKPPRPPPSGNREGGKFRYFNSRMSASTPLLSIDEEQNLPLDGGENGSFESPTTTLTDNFHLPLPNVMKGPQMRQRKIVGSWGGGGKGGGGNGGGGLAQSSQGFGRSNSFENKFQDVAPNHITIPIDSRP